MIKEIDIFIKLQIKALPVFKKKKKSWRAMQKRKQNEWMDKLLILKKKTHLLFEFFTNQIWLKLHVLFCFVFVNTFVDFGSTKATNTVDFSFIRNNIWKYRDCLLGKYWPSTLQFPLFLKKREKKNSINKENHKKILM